MGVYDAIAGQLIGQYRQQLAALQSGGGGHTTINPYYYTNLRARGLTVDPYTGAALPGTADGKQIAATGNVPFDPGGVTFDNPYATPQTEDQRQARLKKIAEQQQSVPFQASQTDFAAALKQFQQPITPAATAADAQRNLLPSPQQRAFGEAINPHVQERARQAAADYVAISKAASEPGVFRSDIDNLQQQWRQKYPEYGEHPPVPLSKAQIAEMEKKVHVEERRDTLESLGMPRGLLVDLDENNKPVWAVTPDQYFRSQYEQSRANREASLKEREYYDNRRDLVLNELRSLKPPEPELGQLTVSDRDMAAYRLRKMQLEGQLEELDRKSTGYSPTAAARAAVPEPAPQKSVTPVEQAIQQNDAVVEIKDKAELQAGLVEGRWPPGTVLTSGGYSAKVGPDGFTLLPLE